MPKSMKTVQVMRKVASHGFFMMEKNQTLMKNLSQTKRNFFWEQRTIKAWPGVPKNLLQVVTLFQNHCTNPKEAL